MLVPRSLPGLPVTRKLMQTVTVVPGPGGQVQSVVPLTKLHERLALCSLPPLPAPKSPPGRPRLMLGVRPGAHLDWHQQVTPPLAPRITELSCPTQPQTFDNIKPFNRPGPWLRRQHFLIVPDTLPTVQRPEHRGEGSSPRSPWLRIMVMDSTWVLIREQARLSAQP